MARSVVPTSSKTQTVVLTTICIALASLCWNRTSVGTARSIQKTDDCRGSTSANTLPNKVANNLPLHQLKTMNQTAPADNNNNDGKHTGDKPHNHKPDPDNITLLYCTDKVGILTGSGQPVKNFFLPQFEDSAMQRCISELEPISLQDLRSTAVSLTSEHQPAVALNKHRLLGSVSNYKLLTSTALVVHSGGLDSIGFANSVSPHSMEFVAAGFVSSTNTTPSTFNKTTISKHPNQTANDIKEALQQANPGLELKIVHAVNSNSRVLLNYKLGTTILDSKGKHNISSMRLATSSAGAAFRTMVTTLQIKGQGPTIATADHSHKTIVEGAMGISYKPRALNNPFSIELEVDISGKAVPSPLIPQGPIPPLDKVDEELEWLIHTIVGEETMTRYAEFEARQQYRSVHKDDRQQLMLNRAALSYASMYLDIHSIHMSRVYSSYRNVSVVFYDRSIAEDIVRLGHLVLKHIPSGHTAVLRPAPPDGSRVNSTVLLLTGFVSRLDTERWVAVMQHLLVVAFQGKTNCIHIYTPTPPIVHATKSDMASNVVHPTNQPCANPCNTWHLHHNCTGRCTMQTMCTGTNIQPTPDINTHSPALHKTKNAYACEDDIANKWTTHAPAYAHAGAINIRRQTQITWDTLTKTKVAFKTIVGKTLAFPLPQHEPAKQPTQEQTDAALWALAGQVLQTTMKADKYTEEMVCQTITAKDVCYG